MVTLDRVCETSTTTGTGNFTVSGAVAGYGTFTEVLSGSDYFYYLIEGVDATGIATGEWETGIGLMTAATTLQRTLVLDNSARDGAYVNFAAGTKRVHLTAPAHQLQHKAVRVTKTADLTGQNLTTATAIAWTNAGNWDTSDPYSGDVGPWHDTVTNNSRITIPAGYDNDPFGFRVDVALQSITSGEWVELKVRVDGSTIIGRRTFAAPTTTPFYGFQCGPYALSTAQYVEAMIQVQTDTTVDIMSVGSSFQIDIL